MTLGALQVSKSWIVLKSPNPTFERDGAKARRPSTSRYALQLKGL